MSQPWTLYLLPRSQLVAPVVLTLEDGGTPPDRINRPDAPELADVDVSPTVYRLALLLPFGHAVYVTDDLATSRLAAGIPEDVPVHHRVAIETVHFDGVDITDSVRSVEWGINAEYSPPPAADASVLDMPPGRARRTRERAVLEEEDADLRALVGERDPDPVSLERERLRRTPRRTS